MSLGTLVGWSRKATAVVSPPVIRRGLLPSKLRSQKRKLQSLLIAFLDDLAKRLNLIKVTAEQNISLPTDPPKPAPMRVELVKQEDVIVSAAEK